MLKFIKGHLQTIDNVEIFPLISFVMFFSMFIVISIWAYKMKQSSIDEMANLPLEDDKK